MSLRSTLFKSALLPLLVAALAVFSVPSFAYDWQTVKPKNGGFSVDFPGAPKLAQKATQDIAAYSWIYGNKEKKFLVLASTSDNYGSHIDADRELQGTEVGFLRQVDGKTTSRKRVKIRGAHGKKLPASIFNFVTSAGWKGLSKVIVDGDTVYITVMMWGPGAHVAAVRKRFLASYKLLPRTRPPKPAAN